MRSATPACSPRRWCRRRRSRRTRAAADHRARHAHGARPRTAPSRTRPWARSTRSILAARSATGELFDAGRAEIEPHLVGGNLADRHRAARRAVEAGATTASTGSTICTPRRRAVSSARARASRCARSRRAICRRRARAREKRERHAAADRGARRPSASRLSTSSILSDTLAPPSTAASGRCGRFEDPSQRLQLRRISRPAAARLGDG